MPKENTCGDCKHIGKLGPVTVCKSEKENSYPGGFEETMASYPACQHFEHKTDWRPDPLVKTGGLA